MPGRDSLKRGALIVVEGIDRSGKSTQCDLLVKRLNETGHKSKLMKFPDRATTIGKMIDSYLKNSCELDDHAIHLLFSANRWEMSAVMKKDLLDGVTLVIDRYAFSGVAYSAAKPGMDMKWCRNSDAGLPKPDLVMFLDLDAEEAQRRAGFGGERYERTDFQKSVYENYEKLSCENWKFVDAGSTVEKVNQNMFDLAVKTIDHVKGREIGRLWMDEVNLFLV